MESIANAVIGLAERHFKDYKIRNGQVTPKYCPICRGGESGDKETFSVGLYNGCFSCLRGSCPGIFGGGKGREGTFQQLSNYFGEVGFQFTDLPRTIGATKKKVYELPDPDKYKDITEECVTYLAKRGISKETLDDWKVGSDEHGNIVFRFFENDKLTFVKYRKPGKRKEGEPKEWAEPNTKPILYGMDMASYNRPLVITEGEIDALSLYQAGVHNVVSVPSGVKNMEWITLCWDWLENFQQIILFGDSDEPGQEMVATLMKRLGEDRCMVPKEYPELEFNGKDYNRRCKDANEILVCYGPEALKSIVDECEPAPIKGVIDLGSVNFIDPMTIPRIMTGIPQLDNMIGGLAEGGVTVISGKRGEGKSTWSGPVLLNAVQEGRKVCAYSGELSSYKFLEWIFLQATETRYIGYRNDPKSGKNYACVDPIIQQRIKDWLSEKFFLYDNSYLQETNQTESVLKVFELCAKRYGCSLFLIDNLMSILCSPDEENKAQARFMSQVKAFANKYKVHVITVAHPRKQKAGEKFTNDDISGSSAISNLADNVLNIERPHIRVTKNRDFGSTGFIRCDYDPASRRIFQENMGDHTRYGWDHTDIPLPEHPALELDEFQLQSSQAAEQPF